MNSIQEKDILEQLSNLGVNDYESLKKIKRKKMIEKFGFSDEQANTIELMQVEGKKEEIDYELLQHNLKKPQKQIKFFKENEINYDTIFQLKLLKLIDQLDNMTPSKITAFKEYKNQCLRLKYNHTKKEESANTNTEVIILMYLNKFKGYLSKEQEEQVVSILRTRIDAVNFESVNYSMFGQEILGSLDIDYELKIEKIDLTRTLLINILKRERKPINLFTIKNRIDYFEVHNIDIQDYLIKLTKEGFVKYTSEGIKYYTPSIKEYIENNKTTFSIIDSRLRGSTLEMIGEETSVTRERIRQKETVQLKQIPVDEIYESRYLKYFINYDLTPKEFCKIFSFDEYQFRFFNLYYKKEKVLMTKEELMESDELTFKEREYLEEILNEGFLFINNKKIRNKKICLIEYLIELYAQEEIVKDDFFHIVRQFTDYHQLDFDFSSDRAIDGMISRADNVLLKYGRRMIHYQIDQTDVLEKLQSIDFDYFINQEITAKKILEAYEVPLNQIDIYDEYELHNLLKKYANYLPKNVKLTRMPFIEVGEVDREEQVINLLIELSPISVDNFVLAYSERYGVFEGTVRANFLNVLEEFKTEETYIADMPVIDSKIENNLKTLLVNEFYFKEDIQKKYTKTFGYYQIPDFLFKKVGYKNYSEFILKDSYSRASQYFEEKFFNQEMFDVPDNRLYLLGSFRRKLEQKISELTVFQYEKNSYINIKRLKSFADIQESDFIELLNQIDDYIGDRYFTFSNVEFLIEKSKLNELGFEPIFYESILKGANQYRYQNLGGTTLFRKTKNKFYSYDFLEEIVSRYKAIDIYDLQDLLDDKYSIKLSKELIVSTCLKRDLYFNPTMEMIYLDIEEFYEMMEG
ncbi:hypothetical protein [Vagococcus carniphilus]|uniref:hypothetical protein n=1 Tax=Vagococcus carniphilus TaxID=218144 RepID=UPI0028926902|nr:hypothetical protein [Vagococcus carniphilus]MDT2814634.1 hypothetical protein [Vagococcus carniphilus]MDT2864253.1 hypothetical protein [Vagococcus carniphilus]